jgi:hypothetical protein
MATSREISQAARTGRQDPGALKQPQGRVARVLLAHPGVQPSCGRVVSGPPVGPSGLIVVARRSRPPRLRSDRFGPISTGFVGMNTFVEAARVGARRSSSYVGHWQAATL